jgi:hypothetical protein
MTQYAHDTMNQVGYKFNYGVSTGDSLANTTAFLVNNTGSGGTILNEIGFQVLGGSKGTVKNLTGFSVANASIAAGGTQIGYSANIAKNANYYAFYSPGTAVSYHLGGFFIGSAVPDSLNKLHVSGGPSLFDSTASFYSVAIFSPVAQTTGTTYTIPNEQTNFFFNPGSLTASYAITLPSAPVDGQLEKLHFGGTILSGAAVVTALTVSANTGQALSQTAAPTTAVGGTCIIYQFNAKIGTGGTWFREQ